ncbi:MAG: hypothetical protein JXA21_05550 [Anaerolineae bacterium]|nr:hypothetical protein [Anaerolineae bacterium]
MSYTYDAPNIKKNGQRVGWAAAFGVFAAIAALLVATLSGDTPALLTAFSSVPAPPGGVTWWDKETVRDSWPTAWWSTVVVTTGTTLEVADVITASTPFTLVETWDAPVLQLTGFITTSGTVITSANSLTWAGSPPTGTLVKAWVVTGSAWSTSAITEVLITASGSQTAVVHLAYGDPPPTPTPTATSPPPTFTPYATSIWHGGSAQFATATPCPGGGCGASVDSPGIAYYMFLPMVFKDE